MQADDRSCGGGISPIALAMLVIATMLGGTPAGATHLDGLKTLSCPSEGPLRCDDIAVYRLSSGKKFLREYHGTDVAGRHHFTDRLESGREVLFVFGPGMEAISAGSTSYEPHNGLTLFGRSANEKWTFAYKAFRKGKFWADVEARCTALGDLKTVEAGKFAANKMVCDSTYSYTDGAIDTRFDTYWYHVPTGQIIAWESRLHNSTKGWGAEMIAGFPAER